MLAYLFFYPCNLDAAEICSGNLNKPARGVFCEVIPENRRIIAGFDALPQREFCLKSEISRRYRRILERLLRVGWRILWFGSALGGGGLRCRLVLASVGGIDQPDENHEYAH